MSWFAVMTKPRQERRALENLQRQKFASYLPLIMERRRRAGQVGWVQVPLFPRYLFVEVDPGRQSIAPIRSTLGCVDVVKAAGQPTAVPAPVIEHIRARINLRRDNATEWSKGQALTVLEGPFAGVESVFLARTSAERVRVLLYWLGQWQRATLPETAVASA